MNPDISCGPSPFGCGLWTFLHLYQVGFAGLLAVVAGILIYASGRSQAKAASSAVENTIAHEREMRRLDRDDLLGRDQSIAVNLVTELRFDAEALRFIVELTQLQLRAIVRLRRRGRLASIPSFKVRLEKLAFALQRSSDRLSLLPWQFSTPAGYLVAWLDDLVVRCRNIDVIFNQKDGSLDFDLWDAEFSFILAGFDDFDEAALAYVSFRTNPAAAFRRYSDRHQAVQRNAILNEQAPAPQVAAPVAVTDRSEEHVAEGKLEGAPPYRNPFIGMRRTLEPPSRI